MAKKRRHQFHCQRCASPCEIYKRGKGHRVLVCPECGVLATNPIVKSLVKRGAKALLGEVPGASLIMEGAGLVGDVLKGGKSEKSNTTPSHPVAFPPAQFYKNKFSAEERVALALR